MTLLSLGCIKLNFCLPTNQHTPIGKIEVIAPAFIERLCIMETIRNILNQRSNICY